MYSLRDIDMEITFIGGGNMASAIIGGLLRESFDPCSICVVEIAAEPRAQLVERYSIHAVAAIDDAVPLGSTIILAVKPQHMKAAAQALAPRLKDEVVVSIAAGIRIADLSRWLGGYQRLIRCMPNTPALIGAGITAAHALPSVSENECAAVERILKAMGKVIWVAAEPLLDTVTAVSGSGPAYVFYFIEALRVAAVELGLTEQQANVLALETFLGSAKLAAQSPEDVATLRVRVTSKGGTTEAALASMARDQVQQAIIRGVRAAHERSHELGVELGRD